MTDRALVQAIYEDRRPRGFTRKDARARAELYEEWLEEVHSGRAERRYDPAEVRRFLDFALQRVDRMAAVYGPQGKGKTNLSAVATELIIACRPSWEVYSNVPYPWQFGAGRDPPRLHLVESLSQLLRELSLRAREGHADAAIILDEFDQVDTSQSWADESSESWSKFVNIKRHYAARGPLVVFHALHLIPLGIRSGATGSAFKLTARRGESVLCDLEAPDEWVATVPRSVLPHLTYGLRGFSLDTDVQALQERFVGSKFRGDRRAVADATLAFLEEQAEERAQLGEALTAREEYDSALRERRKGLAEGHAALVERDRAIMLEIEAGTSRRDIVRKYHTGAALVSKLTARLAALRSQVPGTGASAPRVREERKPVRPEEVTA